jgi:hypothetical protein
MSSPTTALASNTGLIPTRRTSWKSNSNTYTPLFHNVSEKQSTILQSNNPCADSFYSTPLPFCTTDVEAQTDHLRFDPKSKKMSKYRNCTSLLCAIIFWAALIAGLVILLDWVFPGAVSYNKLREMQMEMLDVEKTVDMLKVHVGSLTNYVASFRGSLDGVMSWSVRNGTMEEIVVDGWDGGNVSVL